MTLIPMSSAFGLPSHVAPAPAGSIDSLDPAHSHYVQRSNSLAPGGSFLGSRSPLP